MTPTSCVLNSHHPRVGTGRRGHHDGRVLTPVGLTAQSIGSSTRARSHNPHPQGRTPHCRAPAPTITNPTWRGTSCTTTMISQRSSTPY